MFVLTERLRAKELWNLINICATYSAEPGIFFIDNANEKTNAKAYGQKVVATNPCGEQPLAPYSVCNLAAVNLAELANKENKKVDFEKLKKPLKLVYVCKIMSLMRHLISLKKTKASSWRAPCRTWCNGPS